MGQIINSKRALLITGTIIPNSIYVTHININERRNEYYEALQFYSKQFPNDDIYFLENSDFDFNSDVLFKQLLDEKRITLIKYPISKHFEEGKGYQEFEMLDNCINQIGDNYNEFIKITGRYKVLNIKKLSEIKYENLMADSHKKFKVTQTNLFFVKKEFYRNNLAGLYLLSNDKNGIFIEHVVYKKLIENNIINSVTIFRENPIITGFSGSYGGTLNRNKYKMILRNFERKVLKIIGIHQFIIEY